MGRVPLGTAQGLANPSPLFLPIKKRLADAACHKKVAFWDYSEVISFAELYKHFSQFQTLYR